MDCDCEAVGECEAHRDGGRRFAGLSGREKQGWRDGASAEQGSSLAAKRAKQQLVTRIRSLLDAQRIKKQKIQTKAKHLSRRGTKASSEHLAVCGLQVSACVPLIYGAGKERMKERGLGWAGVADKLPFADSPSARKRRAEEYICMIIQENRLFITLL